MTVLPLSVIILSSGIMSLMASSDSSTTATSGAFPFAMITPPA